MLKCAHFIDYLQTEYWKYASSPLKRFCETVCAFADSETKMDKFLKRAAPEDTKKSTTKRIKLDPAPDPATVYYSVCHASDRQKQDPGFTVSRWGDLKHDLQSKGNIIPDSCRVRSERSMKFEGFCYDAKNARHHECVDRLKCKKPTKCGFFRF